MDRAEAAGFGVAAAGHAALIAALSLGFAAARLPSVRSEPIEVAFVDEIGLVSTAPVPSSEPPAPLQGPLDLPPGPAMPPPPTLQPAPSPQLVATQPKPAPRPTRSVPRPKQVTVPRNTGGLQSVVDGLADRETPSRSADRPAATASPQVEASLRAEVRRQLKPHWRAPTGADAELLRTELAISLAKDGSVTGIELIRTTGQTPSNRPQVKLHQEQAVRAVRLASPFRLPPDLYDAWKLLSPIGFDKRMSQ